MPFLNYFSRLFAVLSIVGSSSTSAGLVEDASDSTTGSVLVIFEFSGTFDIVASSSSSSYFSTDFSSTTAVLLSSWTASVFNYS